MKVFSGIALSFLAAASTAYGASWGFEDATLTVQQKGAGIGGGAKEKWVLEWTLQRIQLIANKCIGSLLPLPSLPPSASRQPTP